jgi:hypothetical protein
VTDTGQFWRDNHAAIMAGIEARRSGPPPPPPAPAHHPGIYAWCKRRELAAYAAGGCVVEVDTGRRYDSRPERLAAARASQPIDLPVYELPRWAREGGIGGACDYATVLPDDTVELRNDTRQWLIDNGLQPAWAAGETGSGNVFPYPNWYPNQPGFRLLSATFADIPICRFSCSNGRVTKASESLRYSIRLAGLSTR